MMKTELYHYAISLNSKNLSDTPHFCIWILLSIFLIPILILKLWIGVIILSSYIVLCLGVKTENDKYNKALLNYGLFMLFLGIESSILVLMQYKIIKSLIMTVFILVVFYEIIFSLKIKLKIYSQKVKSKMAWVNIISLICGGIGVWCGRFISDIVQDTNLKLSMVVIFCSFLFVGAITFFQKFLVYKIIKGT